MQMWAKELLEFKYWATLFIMWTNTFLLSFRANWLSVCEVIAVGHISDPSYCWMSLIGLIGSILPSNMLDPFEHCVGYCWISLNGSIFFSNIAQHVGSVWTPCSILLDKFDWLNLLFKHHPKCWIPVGYCWMSLISSILSSNIIQNVGSV